MKPETEQGASDNTPGEWTVESVSRMLGFRPHLDFKAVADAHNAALTAEREKVRNIGEQLDSYVLTVKRAEREIQQHREQIKELQDVADAALAKVKEGKS